MLRCFVAVATSGNLADAADKLGRTPSAVSMMLKQFEDHLAAPLFESERKSRLTALGTFTLDQAMRELDHFTRTVTAIEHFSCAKAGYVRVAAVPSVAVAILPVALRDFLEGHPDVQIDIQDMDSAAVLQELAMVRADVGVTVLPRLAIDRTEEQLAFLPVADLKAKRRIDILRRSHQAPTPAAEAFEIAIRQAAEAIILPS